MALGDKYMDSVATSTTTTGIFLPVGYDPNDSHWISVRARINDGIGTRAIAVYYAGGLLNCPLDDELSLLLTSPNAPFPGCTIVDSTVVVKVFNNALNTQTNISVSYQLGNNPICNRNNSWSIDCWSKCKLYI